MNVFLTSVFIDNFLNSICTVQAANQATKLPSKNSRGSTSLVRSAVFCLNNAENAALIPKKYRKNTENALCRKFNSHFAHFCQFVAQSTRADPQFFRHLFAAAVA